MLLSVLSHYWLRLDVRHVKNSTPTIPKAFVADLMEELATGNGQKARKRKTLFRVLTS